MQLGLWDFIIIGVYLLISLGLGIYFRRLATRSVSDFFVSGRNIPWWLAGTSMVATTFAADTPLAVTGIVARNGVAGNWIWWSMAFSGLLTVFFFARLWRRSQVLTDVEFVAIRYSGAPARFLRGFRAFYLGLLVNIIVMGWVNLAMVKIFMLLFGISKFQATLLTLGVMLITAVISTLAGLWGVLVTDFFQFLLMMSMVIILAVYAVQSVGGMSNLTFQINLINQKSGETGSLLSFWPAINSTWMPWLTLFVYLFVNWWASWYPGAEPGGGGFIAQRILCARDERHSLLATLWFNLAHYALRPWPWILVALVAMVKFQGDPSFTADPESGYIRIMLLTLPGLFRGLMVAGFLAAYMSTIATELNWGASYLINDLYRPFMARQKSERHYVIASQLATMILMILASLVCFFMQSIAEAWKFLIALGAGTGLVYLLRWFWWRINAWSEISAMAAAFISSLTYQRLFGWQESRPLDFAYLVLATTATTTIIWLTTTLLTRPESQEILLNFYRRIRPAPTFWRPIAQLAPEVVPDKYVLRNFIDWLMGVAMIYALLFGLGHLLFSRWIEATGFIIFGIGCAYFIYWDLSRRGFETVLK
ncbi:MAG: Na+:solute symporter [Candidatus Aminicenantes bacterium]|nr:Na+:solute symporter [Candidatus Aminicenantes bacterium]